MYFYVEPEVAGGLGNATEIDTSVHPPIVKKLNFNLEGWLGDELLETFPCFIVTKRVERAIRDASLEGVEFRPLLVTFSEGFAESHPAVKAPDFSWMHVIGKAGLDDFGIAEDLRLVISEAAKKILEAYGLKYADLEAFS